MHKIFVVFTLLFISIEFFGQVPSINCEEASVFCNAEDFENIVFTLPDTIPGMTSLDFPKKLCPEGGQPNNMLYFSFVPNSQTVTIEINSLSCEEGFTNADLGYQWGVFESCNEIYESDPYSLICQAFANINEGNVGLSTATSSDFVPGNTYILFVDGFGGSVCDFTISVTEGMSSVAAPFVVDEPTHFTNSVGDLISFGDTIDYCTNGFFTITAHGSNNHSAYLWSSSFNEVGDEILQESNADTLKLTFTEADSIYKICAIATTDCDSSLQECFYVRIESIPNDSLGIFEYCSADLAAGILPTGWKDDVINKAGIHNYTVIDTLLGCTYDQVVKIVEKYITIAALDSVICGMDSVFIAHDTITDNFFDKQFRFENAANNGCDSLLNFTLTRFNLEGDISELVCLGNGQFGIEITPDNIIPANPDSIVVTWFKDNVPIHISKANDFQLPVTDKGIYGAIITVFNGSKNCSFDMTDVEIDQLISSEYSISTDSICLLDTILVELSEFHNAANYEWTGADQVIQNAPGSYQLIWNSAGDYNLELKVNYGSCEIEGIEQNIYVEASMAKPWVNCLETSLDTISISWDLVDCASEYEIWLDGTYFTTVDHNDYIFYDLEEGKKFEIIINALSDCLCPASSDTTFCTTKNCSPDIEVFLDQLPLEFCPEDLTVDLQLTGSVSGSTGGTVSWFGDIISSDGLIDHNTVSPGIYPLTFQYEIEDCYYEITDTFTLHPGVEFEVNKSDITCYYNNDGEISILPLAGTAPFTTTLNGTSLMGLDTSGLSEGMYQILLNDANNCINSFEIEIFKPTKPEILIEGITLIERGEIYEYEISISNIEYDSIVWYVTEFDTILCKGNCDQISYAPLIDQELCIEIFYDDYCSIDTCIQLLVNRDVEVYLPNVFTPGNKDGYNDFFMVKTNAYEQLKLNNFSVFDRWGSLLFNKNSGWISSQTDDSFGWDGTFEGKAVMSGVYVYYIEMVDNKGNLLKYYGDITLLR